MAAKKKKRGIALAMALVTVALLVAFIIASERSPWLSEKLSGAFKKGSETEAQTEIYEDELPGGTVEVHVIDVGQADSSLIICPAGNILIDTGIEGTEPMLEEALRGFGVEKLDYLILTHPHDDHIGGADMILERFDVGLLLMTDISQPTNAYERLIGAVEATGVLTDDPAAGDVYTLGDVSFTVLGPVEDYENVNDMSITLKLIFGETSFLFTGDAEEAAELALLYNYDSDQLDCDYYKVGHHGAGTSSTLEFLEAITPEVAVVSCGKDNEYGHPHGEVITRLKFCGCREILRTDELGTVSVTSDGGTLTVAASDAAA